MRVFLAGATGVIGRQLVPMMLAEGHAVVGTTSRPSGLTEVSALGAEPVLMDGLDVASVRRAVLAAEPEVVVHQMTSLGGSLDLRHFERTFAATNRLRTEGTDALLLAAREAGVGRVVAQSFAGWPFARAGSWIKTEDEPLDPTPVKAMATTHAALCALESAVLGIDWGVGIVLRYGLLSGPGTSLDDDGEQTRMIRRRRFPVVGDGAGMFSIVDVRDAAAATVLAVQGAPGGIYHVAADPLPARELLPAVAAGLGAPPPRRVPRWLGRLAAGEAAAVMMTQSRGASNEKARRVLGWQPQHPTWPAQAG